MAPQPPPVSHGLLDQAVALATEAGRLTLRWFGTEGLQVERKGDGTPVTAADRASERLLREKLATAFPDDAVAGEEEVDRPGTTGRRWVIDPIDGTIAFTRGVPLYSTLLALEDEHGPAIGVIALPALDEVVYAGRGVGCFHDGALARVSARDRLQGAFLTTSGLSHWPEGVLTSTRAAGLELRTWGDGYGYALVATGRVEAMVDTKAAVWDLAPMMVIVSEAGGRFTDLTGVARADGGHGLASNGVLHDQLLATLSFSTQ